MDLKKSVESIIITTTTTKIQNLKMTIEMYYMRRKIEINLSKVY